MIKFEDVSKSYLGGFQAIQKVSFRVNQGEMVYLRGHSGAGKSSLLKLIAAIERPTLGRIYFNNQNITNISRNDIPYLRRQIGMIFQDYQLINRKTIYENIALPLQIENYNELNIEKRVMAALDLVGLLDKRQCFPPMLSGGEQQRVGIARAIVHSPKLLLADEPTGNLDRQRAFDILKLFSTLNMQGVTIILATHDNELLTWKQCRQLVLDHGRLVGDIP